MLDMKKIMEIHLNIDSGYGKNDPPELFHPSSMGYCLRQIFRSKAKLTEFSTYIKGCMKVGTILHEHIQSEVLENYPIEVEKEVKSADFGGIFFQGKIDILHKGIPYDIKSSGARYLPKEPLDHHVSQLNTYMGMIGAEKGYLVYVSKNSMSIEQVEIKFNIDLYKLAVYKAHKVYDELVKYNEGDEIPFAKCKCYFCRSERTYKNAKT